MTKMPEVRGESFEFEIVEIPREKETPARESSVFQRTIEELKQSPQSKEIKKTILPSAFLETCKKENWTLSDFEAFCKTIKSVKKRKQILVLLKKNGILPKVLFEKGMNAIQKMEGEKNKENITLFDDWIESGLFHKSFRKILLNI